MNIDFTHASANMIIQTGIVEVYPLIFSKSSSLKPSAPLVKTLLCAVLFLKMTFTQVVETSVSTNNSDLKIRRREARTATRDDTGNNFPNVSMRTSTLICFGPVAVTSRTPFQAF